MKKTGFLLILASLLLLLCACEKDQGQTIAVSAYKSKGVYTDLGDEKLSREGLAALAQKYPGMTTQEARQTCVDFWSYVKNALWIPADTYEIYKEHDDGSKTLARTVEQGKIYGAIPYVGSSTGSIYRMLDYLDPETGVLNIKEAGKYPLRFGSMCSSGCYWAWSRVMNSADYCWCADSVVRRGYLRVGPYTYDDGLWEYMEQGYGTDDIALENGEQTMYRAYAAMDIADGLIAVWEKNGHTMMCTVAPHVEYFDDGTINGVGSFLCITEQGGSGNNVTSPQGHQFYYEGGYHKKTTFETLYKKCYIPFTFGELIGTDPVEETEVSFSHTGDTITKKELLRSTVTANYNISDVHVTVRDSKGNEVYKLVDWAIAPSTRELRVNESIGACQIWGDWDSLDPKKEYTLTVEVQLGTGERPTLWEGKLTL